MPDWILFVAGAVLIISGIIGCFLPGLPGPPLAYLGVIAFHFSILEPFSVTTLIIYGILIAGITLLDYFVPSLGAKFSGGTKYGSRGAMLGIIGTLFIPGVGIFLGPFLGAVLGELIGGMKFKEALKSGLGAFLGLLGGSIIKFLFCIYMTIHMIISMLA